MSECYLTATGWTTVATLDAGTTFSINDFVNYAICPPMIVDDCKTVPNKKEHNMGIESTYSADQEARRHLGRRTESVYSDQYRAIRTKFHMDDDELPKTKDEIMAALKAGQVEFMEYYFDKDGTLRDEDYGLNGSFYIVDPKRDKAGYESAEKLLGKAYSSTKDAILVKTPEDGLTALQAFEAQTF